MRPHRTVVAVLGALALVTALPTSASAANGTLHYVNVNGDDFSTDNPVNGECYLLVSGAAHVDNGTDTTATVFGDHGCEEILGPPLPPGTARDFGAPVPHSVLFN
ncbi:hypothetical protein [Streptomyces sp. KL118A]|uniref:hypothetical protein n=1 Tax=Streptomyces sp. KL118A TaxID=3045153 RepID=UPI00278C8654|nr:hypothetical protein [Streptomyces sp. KL118A]